MPTSQNSKLRWLGAIGACVALSSCSQPPATPPSCQDPLSFGDASWLPPPFTQPGVVPEEPDEPYEPNPPSSDSGDPGGGGADGIGFISDPDGGGATFECDPWLQDCPAGQKCMPWANDGGSEWNATRCTEVSSMPGQSGDPCTAEGSGVSGVDSCDIGHMCWDVDRGLMGECVEQCQGSEQNPDCPSGTSCTIDNDGVITLCLPEGAGTTGGSSGGTTGAGDQTTPDQLADRTRPSKDPEPVTRMCPDTYDPVVLHMSNDDSNSQASPILARRRISENTVVSPEDIRIHEFLNYYDFSPDGSPDQAARVRMQMRRIGDGEFTLVLQASGREMTARRPMNLVFSLDTSGSMSGERMSLLKETMRATAGSLIRGDIVSVVSWHGEASTLISGHAISGKNDPTLLGLIDALEPRGSTNLYQGLLAAYQLANEHRIVTGINRVMIISDGGANAGITEANLIADEARDGDQEGIYLVGVGVGTAADYRDELMDELTDAGKGSYTFIDRPEEAHKMFGERFLANVAVSARNVRMKLTLPWYFGIKAFHGEQISPSPEKVRPQHLAPNDAMTFHQVISSCDAAQAFTCDPISAEVEYVHPITGILMTDRVTATIGDLVSRPADVLHKADIVVGYAKSLILIGRLHRRYNTSAAINIAQLTAVWLENAAYELDDPDLRDIAALMKHYVTVLGG